MALAPMFKRAYWALAAAGAAYFLLLLTFGSVKLQRIALYANKLHTGYWQDINRIEKFGFLKNQIIPFGIDTPDGERLYAWHVLPVSLYADHEPFLVQEPPGPREDVTRSLGFQLLSGSPDSRLIISSAEALLTVQNAGHVAQGWRTDTYKALYAAAPDKMHILTVDYRGFGHSTGSPSEDGLIKDAIATVDWALNVAKVPPSRIVILGQSLGTAVATAVAEHFAVKGKVEFAGVILVAPFTDLPKLMLTYSAGGVVPVLSPLRPYPRLQKWFSSFIGDTWNTSDRLGNFIRTSQRVRLQLIHSKDDFDIPWTHSEDLFYAAVNAASDVDLTRQQIDESRGSRDMGEGGWVHRWGNGGDKEIGMQIVRHGGHNRLMTYAPVTLAVLRAFGL